MSTLEQLIGKPLHECTDQELQDWVMQGRLAREAEADGARAGKTRKAGGGGKKKQVIPDFDLLDDDDDVPELELELED